MVTLQLLWATNGYQIWVFISNVVGVYGGHEMSNEGNLQWTTTIQLQ